MLKKVILVALMAVVISGCRRDPRTTVTENYLEAGLDSVSGYAPVNGLRMYYEIRGSGTPLVLIHGGGSTAYTSFGRVINEFAKNHKVIAVDMQAHGHTADIDRPLSFQKDADDIAALLKYLDIDKADIFGFSNGASTTLQFAIRHPEMTRRIIVASTFYKRAGAPEWFWNMMANPTFEGMPQAYKDAFLKINPDTSALYRMYERDVARMKSFPDIPEDQMKSIKAPAFIIIGENDVTTPEHAREMQRLLSNARLAVLPGGHGDYIGELTTTLDTTLVAATVTMINDFLKEPQ